MKILANLPPRKIEGADEVLEGFVGECASGNQVRAWPAMTYDDERNQTRIAFFTEWRQGPTPNDTAELIAFTDSMMGKPPELMTECGKADPTTVKENIDWLRTGKAPARRRAN